MPENPASASTWELRLSPQGTGCKTNSCRLGTIAHVEHIIFFFHIWILIYTQTHTHKFYPAGTCPNGALPSLIVCYHHYPNVLGTSLELCLFLTHTLSLSVYLCLSLSCAEAAGVWAALCIHYQLAELWISHTPTEKVPTICSHHDFEFHLVPHKMLSSTCNSSGDLLSRVVMCYLSNPVKKQVRYCCFVSKT